MHSTGIGATFAPLIPTLTALIGSLVHGRAVRARGGDVLEVWIRWWLAGGLVLGATATAVSFWVDPHWMAGQIGYTASPFQFEIAGANFGAAVAGSFACRFPAWRLPVTVGSGIFWWVAAVGHIWQALVHHDWSPGNTFGVCISDILIPGVLLALLLRERRRTTGVTPRAA